MISITLTTYDLLFILATATFSVWRLCVVAEDFSRNTSTIDLIFKRISYTIPKRTRLNSTNTPTTAIPASTDDPTIHSSSLNATYEINVPPAIPGSFDAGVEALSHEQPLPSESPSPQPILFKVSHATSDSTHSEPLRGDRPSEGSSPSLSPDLRRRLDNNVPRLSRAIDRLAVHAGPSTSASLERTLIGSPLSRDVLLRLATDEGEANDLVDGDEQADQASIGEIPDEDSSPDADGLPVTIDSGERKSLRDARPRLFASHGVQTVPLPPLEIQPALPSTQTSPLSLSSGPTPADNDDASSLPERPLLSASAGSAQNSLPFPSVEPPHIQEALKELQPPPIPPKNPRRRETVPSRPPFLLRTVNRKRSGAELSPILGRRPPLSDTRSLVIDQGKAREVPMREDSHPSNTKDTTNSRDSLALGLALNELEYIEIESSSERVHAPSVSQPAPGFERLRFLHASYLVSTRPYDAVPLGHGTAYPGYIVTRLDIPEKCSAHWIRGHEYKLKSMAWRADSQIPEPMLRLDEHGLDATYAILDQECQCNENSALVRIRDVVQHGSDICIITNRYDGTLRQLLDSLLTLPPPLMATIVFKCLTDVWRGVHEMHALKIFHRDITSSSILYNLATDSDTYNFYIGDFLNAVSNPGPDKEEQLMKNDFRALLHLISFIAEKFRSVYGKRVAALVKLLQGTLENMINAETGILKATVDSGYLARLNYEQLCL